MLYRTLGVTTVRMCITGSCLCVDAYQNFRILRLSSRASSLSKIIWHPDSDFSNNGMRSRPSTGHGRADYSFSCATSPGSTASSALSSYVPVYRICYPYDKTNPNTVSPSQTSSFPLTTIPRRQSLTHPQISSPPPSYYSYHTHHPQPR